MPRETIERPQLRPLARRHGLPVLEGGLMPVSSTKSTRKPKPPPSLTPWPCVALAVDTARLSGWSIFEHGHYRDSGITKADDFYGIGVLCARAVFDARHSDPRMAAVLVLERPSHGNLGTTVGLGKAHGVWEAAWKEAGGAKRRIVRVYPATWRAAVLGMTRGEGSNPTARERHLAAIELGTASSLSNKCQLYSDGRRQLTRDEAAAICIGRWACHAGEVGAVLPKRRKAVA